MQDGMNKPYIFRVVIEPLGDERQRVIFCRKCEGVAGWERGKPHVLHVDSPSYYRAQRAAVSVMRNM